MKYRLRNFENNFQMLNSMGWIFIGVSLVFLMIKQNPAMLIVTVFGAGMIWLQLKGKRIHVDTDAKTVKSDEGVHTIQHPTQIFMNEVTLAQRVNSRVNSANVRTRFYKAYLQDGEEKILLSSNRREERDWKKLEAIATDLKIDLVKHY